MTEILNKAAVVKVVCDVELYTEGINTKTLNRTSVQYIVTPLINTVSEIEENLDYEYYRIYVYMSGDEYPTHLLFSTKDKAQECHDILLKAVESFWQIKRRRRKP